MKATRVLTSKFISSFGRTFPRQFAKQLPTKTMIHFESEKLNLKQKLPLKTAGLGGFFAVFGLVLACSVLAYDYENAYIRKELLELDLDGILGKDLSYNLYKEWASFIRFETSQGADLNRSAIQTKKLIKDIEFAISSKRSEILNSNLVITDDKQKELAKLSQALILFKLISQVAEENQRDILIAASKKFLSEVIAEENAKLRSNKEQITSRTPQTPYVEKDQTDHIAK